MRDYFAEEVEGKPQVDYFDREIAQKKPEHPTSLLQRAAKIAMAGIQGANAAPLGVNVKANSQFPFLPSVQMPTDSSLFDAPISEDPTQDAVIKIGGNVLGNAAASLHGAGRGLKKAFPYASQEGRVDFTKGVEGKLINRRTALTRSFGKSLDRSKAKVDIRSIVEPDSTITELTMKEAQDLKNQIASGIPDNVKKGVKVSPKHFQNREIAGIITDLMKKADPAMGKTIENYGKHAENFKDAIGPIQSLQGPEKIFGGNLLKKLLNQGTMPEKSQVALKSFAPRVAKEVEKASLNENIFRGIRGAAVGGAVWPFIPKIAKRAVAAEITK